MNSFCFNVSQESYNRVGEFRSLLLVELQFNQCTELQPAFTEVCVLQSLRIPEFSFLYSLQCNKEKCSLRLRDNFRSTQLRILYFEFFT